MCRQIAIAHTSGSVLHPRFIVGSRGGGYEWATRGEGQINSGTDTTGERCKNGNGRRGQSEKRARVESITGDSIAGIQEELRRGTAYSVVSFVIDRMVFYITVS